MSDKSYDWDGGPRDDDDFDEHEQPFGFDEDEGWEFNDTCECRQCQDNHVNLEFPLEWCDCDGCANLHAGFDAPVDGCECEHCVELDQHESVGGDSERWPWVLTRGCSCARCVESGPEDDFVHEPSEAGQRIVEFEEIERDSNHTYSDSLFRVFQQVNAGTMRKGASWSPEEDTYLLAAYFENISISDIAARLMRTDYALVRRLIRVLLEDRGLNVKASEDIEYILDDAPWAESDRLACRALFRSGFTPTGIASTLKRRPLSVAVELIKDPDLFR